MNENKNPYLIPLAIVLAGALIGAALYFSGSKVPGLKKAGTGEEAPSLAKPGPGAISFTISEKDHVRGEFGAPVTIVEFSDFQCPFCQRFHLTMQQALKEYPGQVRWVYKHFPLDSLHNQARPAAEASECAWEQANNQGFWQFADGLFENQARLSPALYEELAAKLGLDGEQFKDCFASRKYQGKVEADYQEGARVGVRGTPGNFVNGISLPGAVPYEQLKAVIDQALKSGE